MVFDTGAWKAHRGLMACLRTSHHRGGSLQKNIPKPFVHMAAPKVAPDMSSKRQRQLALKADMTSDGLLKRTRRLQLREGNRRNQADANKSKHTCGVDAPAWLSDLVANFTTDPDEEPSDLDTDVLA